MDPGDRSATGGLAGLFRRQLTAALEEGSRTRAEHVVREAVDAQLPLDVIYDEVIALAMHEIGAKWAAGELTVADEHLATSIAYGLLPLLAELSRVAEERRREAVVLAAVEGERHVMGLKMAGDVLEGAGFPVFFLGADIPTDSLLDLLTRKAIALCGLTATMPEAGARMVETVRLIEDLLPQMRVLAGGQAASALVAAGPLTAVVEDVAAVVETADGLLQAAGLN